MTDSNRMTPARIAPARWPTEMPLFVAVVFVAVLIWILMIISIFGIVYAVMLGLFFFVSHIAFVSHLRGSGVKLGPDQFPELHSRIEDLSRAMQMQPPDAYMIQAGGTLNAFATRFLGRNIMVLYSDLLEACADNEGARDMIIAHELAHLKCGHLRWMWLTLPGLLVPFLGTALSRAREYTCDRFGLEGAGSTQDAILGLTILAAGPKFGPQVNLQAFGRQRADMNTGLMKIGEWFGSHPPMSRRVVALDPLLGQKQFRPAAGRTMALAILAVLFLGVGGLTAGAAMLASGEEGATLLDPQELGLGLAQVDTDFRYLAAFIAQEWEIGTAPETMDHVRRRWLDTMQDPFPIDPFDGFEYGYDQAEGVYRLWSSGPDGEPGSADDIIFESWRG